MIKDPKQLQVEVIQQWLIAHLASALNIAATDVDIHTSFDRYGLDSVAAISLIGDLEEWLDQELPATLAWDYENIDELSHYLAELVA